ncbi:calcium/sodium antiporter [Zooshikella ganghwensis]|uniref:calcium/sodium antiporter n=1 Tax=Zooshikella ganghwensis TaxID=202772 RepID=UPI002D80A9EB|nr:calcium/sodium antiporter [Zooshikella ganghwensis]
MSLLLAFIAVLVGFAILIWSADMFVDGAAASARNLGMSTMMIGLTIVAFGTSAPEILVSIMAATDGHSGLAAGNALGSNIANIGLVLGITALVAPLPIKSSLLRKEVPLLLAVTLLAGICLFDSGLTLLDGTILLCGLGATLYFFYRWQRSSSKGTDPLITEEEEAIPEISQKKATVLFICGLALLLFSSRILVWGATEVAQWLGVSELIIGLTVVAIGTSLPELAASIASAKKNHHDIAIGNVVGSNLFNLLAVLPMPALIHPDHFSSLVFQRDYLTMLLLTGLLVGMIFWGKIRQSSLSRVNGSCLVACYVGYCVVLYLTHSL